LDVCTRFGGKCFQQAASLIGRQLLYFRKYFLCAHDVLCS